MRPVLFDYSGPHLGVAFPREMDAVSRACALLKELAFHFKWTLSKTWLEAYATLLVEVARPLLPAVLQQMAPDSNRELFDQGFLRIVLSPMESSEGEVIHGVVITENDEHTVVINSASPPFRRAWSLVHELGHVAERAVGGTEPYPDGEDPQVHYAAYVALHEVLPALEKAQ